MEHDRFLESRFYRWHAEQSPYDHEQSQALGQRALELLVESVNAGEINSLDGVDSPLSQRIKAHHRRTKFEMNSNWIGASQSWTCPCCARSKFQISRIGKKSQILAKLVIHHDHMGEAMEAAFHAEFVKAGTSVEQVEGKRLVERMGGAFAAYDEVLICEDCNNADTQAKKEVGSPQFFSFSISQIQRFIHSGDHRQHTVNRSTAQQIWEQAQAAYELRMKLIGTVAHAAVTDTHWHEPYPRGTSAVPVFGYTERIGDAMIRQWITTDLLHKALGPIHEGSSRELSRWRTVTPKAGAALPKNFLAMLRSDENRAAAWDSVREDWQCPICRRSKEQTVYVGEGGKISFYPKRNRGRGAWANAPTICNHCDSTLMRLKLELSDRLGSTPADSYGFVTPDELACIIVARPHSAHAIHSSEAEALLLAIVRRLSGKPMSESS